jgi:hypothetical protein
MLTDFQIEAFFESTLAFMGVVTVHVVLLHSLAALVRRGPVGSLAKVSYIADISFILKILGSLFAINFITNGIWGSFIVFMDIVPTFRNTFFFSLENYTSLGLTRVQVDDRWRTLAPLISLSGVFCLSYSTAILVTVFSHVYTAKDTST